VHTEVHKIIDLNNVLLLPGRTASSASDTQPRGQSGRSSARKSSGSALTSASRHGPGRLAQSPTRSKRARRKRFAPARFSTKTAERCLEVFDEVKDSVNKSETTLMRVKQSSSEPAGHNSEEKSDEDVGRTGSTSSSSSSSSSVQHAEDPHDHNIRDRGRNFVLPCCHSNIFKTSFLNRSLFGLG